MKYIRKGFWNYLQIIFKTSSFRKNLLQVWQGWCLSQPSCSQNKYMKCVEARRLPRSRQNKKWVSFKNHIFKEFFCCCCKILQINCIVYNYEFKFCCGIKDVCKECWNVICGVDQCIHVGWRVVGLRNKDFISN